MSAHGFKSVYMAASVVGAALVCYLVSLNVASERAKLEAVEEQIVLAQRDIRVLQTEIGTRGRLAQLERWNARFIRLSAPSADQFVEGGFQLAALARPDKRPVIEAPVILAAAPAAETIAKAGATSDGANAQPPAAADKRAASDMLHTASLARPLPPAAKKLSGPPPAKPKSTKSATADPLAPLPVPDASGGNRAPVSLPVQPKDPTSAR